MGIVCLMKEVWPQLLDVGENTGWCWSSNWRSCWRSEFDMVSLASKLNTESTSIVGEGSVEPTAATTGWSSVGRVEAGLAQTSDGSQG